MYADWDIQDENLACDIAGHLVEHAALARYGALFEQAQAVPWWRPGRRRLLLALADEWFNFGWAVMRRRRDKEQQLKAKGKV